MKTIIKDVKSYLEKQLEELDEVANRCATPDEDYMRELLNKQSFKVGYLQSSIQVALNKLDALC